MLDELRKIGAAIGWDAAEDRRRFQGDPLTKRAEDSYNFLGRTFKVGAPGETSFVNESDLEENLRQVRNARAFADKVIVSLHCHDLGGPTLLTAKRRSEIADLADYAIDFGRRSIEAGADIFVCHGPQVPLAVELYRGRPMLHGIGTFIFQIETMKYLPAEAYQRYGLGDRATPADFICALPGRHAGSCGRSAPMGADVCDLRVRRRQSRRSAAVSDRPRPPASAHRPRPADAGGSGHGGPHSGRRRAAVGEIRHPDRTSGRNWLGASLGRMATLSRHRSRSTSARNVAQTAPEAVVVGIPFSAEGQGFCAGKSSGCGCRIEKHDQECCRQPAHVRDRSHPRLIAGYSSEPCTHRND